MDVIDLIKNDHEQIAEMMEKVSETKDGKLEEREQSFNRLRNLLEAHMSSEERTLYQNLEENDELADQMAESYEEHEVISGLLQSLSELEFNDSEWLSKFGILRENVENHVAEEEGQVLLEAEGLLKDEEREEMADDMRSLEDEIISVGPGYISQTPAQTLIDTKA